MRNWRRNPAAVALSAAAMLFCLAMAAAPGLGQSLTGRWAATGGKLDDGEIKRAILDLTQTGSELKGMVSQAGGDVGVNGTVKGNHFELYAYGLKDPVFVGDLVDGELRLTIWGDPYLAKPATPADKFVKPAYIAPPPLSPVPYNGLAKTPPMGWNSWNLFESKIDDQTVRTMTDAMVFSGMRDAGYIYVNIDDTWEGLRDAHGNLTANHKFPDMKALADYVHSKGLKLGIYSSPGPRTCGGYPASYGHEEQDAKTFAAWGIDYLKYDWCSAGTIYKDEQLQPVYQKMGDDLQSTSRPIVYSLCEYGMGDVQKWGALVGANLWRTTGDISDKWESMIGNIEQQAPTAPTPGPATGTIPICWRSATGT